MLSQAAIGDDVLFFRPHQFLARENEPVTGPFQLLEGWACQYRMLSDGRRQITSLYLPGECCDPVWALGRPPSQPVVALTIIRATRMPLHASPGATAGLEIAYRKSLADVCQRQYDWLVSLGRKTAMERLAHLLLELFERMRRAGLTYGQQCAFPLTQLDIADITGLTPVHVNRTLQSMRTKGLVELQSKWLRIPDLDALREVAALAPYERLAEARTP